jgi:hypothetical protein
MVGEVLALLLTDRAGFSMGGLGALGNPEPALAVGSLGTTTAVAHSVQNSTPSAIGWPHLGQPLTAVPHSVQNLTPSAISCAHFLQLLIS